MKKILVFLLLILPLLLFSQNPKNKEGIIDEFYIIKNDSLTIPLDEVIVFDKRDFNSKKERRYYYWYYKKVHKAYPFAKIASDTLVADQSKLRRHQIEQKEEKDRSKVFRNTWKVSFQNN